MTTGELISILEQYSRDEEVKLSVGWSAFKSIGNVYNICEYNGDHYVVIGFDPKF